MITNRYQIDAYISNNNLKMKNVLLCLLILLCSMPISAQRNKKLETKAKTYAEKYERVGNELTISFVEENIPLSRQEIYSVFPALLDKQFNIHDDEIESRDALGKSVKCSLTRKVINTGNINVISNFKMKLDAKDGKARISIRTDGYSLSDGAKMNVEEPVCSRPPFVELESNTEKGMKLNEFYYDTFLHLDKNVEDIIKNFCEYWQKVRK